MNAQELDWNDLHFALAVCREGSLSGAARRLGVNHSTVFRRIAAIEEKLGVRLFERLPGGYHMTEAGEAVLKSGERVENEIVALSRELVGRDLQLHGTLRITATEAFAKHVLTPHIAAFAREYPQIKIDFIATTDTLNLSHREADIAIRSTRQPPESVVGRRLCKLATTFYASSHYLSGFKEVSAKEYDWLMPDDVFNHVTSINWLDNNYAEARVRFRTNSFDGLLQAVKNHMGVAPLPCFLGDQVQGIERIIEPPKELESEFWLLSHPDLRRTARVRAFVEFLTEAIKQDIELVEGRGKR